MRLAEDTSVVAGEMFSISIGEYSDVEIPGSIHGPCRLGSMAMVRLNGSNTRVQKCIERVSVLCRKFSIYLQPVPSLCLKAPRKKRRKDMDYTSEKSRNGKTYCCTTPGAAGTTTANCFQQDHIPLSAPTGPMLPPADVNCEVCPEGPSGVC